MQTLSKTRNTYKNAEHGLISKFMKNLSSDSDKTLMN